MYSLKTDAPELQQEILEQSFNQYLLSNHSLFKENEGLIDLHLFTGNRKKEFNLVRKHILRPDLHEKPNLTDSPMLGALDVDFQKALKILAEFASARELAGGLQESLVAVRDMKIKKIDVHKTLTKCLKTLTDARGRLSTGTKIVNGTVATTSMLMQLEQRHKDFAAKNYYPGLEIGYNCHALRRMKRLSESHLDDYIGGLQTGIHCLAGAPGAGKTTLANNIAYKLAISKIPTLFISFEMPSEKMILKNICMAYELEESRVNIGREDIKKVRNAFHIYQERLSYINYVDADRHTTVDEVATMAASLQARQGKKLLIIVDYLQLWAKLTRDEKSSGFDTNTLVSNMIGQIRAMARALDVPVLLLASQNRASQASGRATELISLKDSGDIEYTADTVWFLNPNPDHEGSESNDISKIILTIAKNRYGEAPKKCMFNYHKKLNLFTPEVSKEDYYREINGSDFYRIKADLDKS